MANRNINGDVNVEFNEASSRQGLDSGESVKTLFGKIRKWLSDLKAVAFSGSYNDLTNKPTIPPAVAVKGNAETAYRTGNVNLTAANIGAVNKNGDTMSGTLTDTEKFIAKSANINRDGDNPSTLTSGNEFRLTDKSNLSVGGMYPQQETSGAIRNILYSRSGSSYNTLAVITDKDGTSRYSVSSPSAFRTAIGLNNVNNTSDLNKPISTATQAALDSQQEQINYNTNNGVKNLISTEWFIEGNYSTIESRNDKTGSLTGSAPASVFAPYIQTYIPEDIVNSILENGKTYILSWNVDSRTNDGIFGIRKTIGVYTSSATLNRTGNYSVSYTHDSSVPVFISLCINTSATSSVKRIALSNVMLREVTIDDDTFEPYAKTNAELTQDLDDISGELDCLLIQAALVNDEVIIQNTSDFTSELYSKYFSYTKPKFAILKLQRTSNTYCYKALLNSSSVGQGNSMDASFITVGGTYMGIYRFGWSYSGTVGTPVVSYTSLNIGS